MGPSELNPSFKRLSREQVFALLLGNVGYYEMALQLALTLNATFIEGPAKAKHKEIISYTAVIWSKTNHEKPPDLPNPN